MFKDKFNVLFMGTPEFAVDTLEMLIHNHNVLAVVTQPDKPQGRGYKLKSSPVKEVALKYSIDVYQPDKVKDNDEFINKIRNMDLDLIIVVAYGKILPSDILNIPKFGCINSHASLLPRHRGAAPINFAIISGDNKSGITTMFMDEGLDTGDIIEKYEVEIEDYMTAGQLHDKLKLISAYGMKDTLQKIKNGTIKRQKQDDSKSTYAPIITKEFAHIDFSKSARDILNLIKGLNPWPVAYCLYEEKKIKLYEAKEVSINEDKYIDFSYGQIVEINDDGLLVKCGQGFILITTIQFENKKVMSIKSFLNGNIISKVRLN
ncbi:methionyl-tRNA formyltransferase [Candidatus Arthromitus sp. SFB-mouse-Japan]|uniref:methionyl-tRNA formyltransferase n=1 Tax=unclassified Candidatus Neoarthromitus TaxID=2638829 RepID=UPI00021B8002|nr:MULTISPECIES: methionyl-tRNA formyltransferase [unclassified Candidatus Arthromitus]EIA27150.1 Methionyl-tRNA formyltransferase [Candidatus Arthromitus sp. SFB-co]EIA30649.1 Methionyl-tRNA formyltransferase [Candidatus Arthromitus sp. SFB-mouse-SU]EIA31122.1 Methionyl-tRNA formyltransferase [Candidatus Arthromitus sp. SFB-5]AID44547.1 Methionyl-tRNA formyltransferase [Candidatus Arthromitus sp. SFB-mouse-NL]BAK56378.1 methionyl-tRNA formyltransferase [Candidatus Arthromitus sp. SFB-mouse-Ja